MENVTLARDGAIATVTLNRPDRRNSLSDAMLTDLGAAFVELRDDTSTRVVIVTGAPPVFSAVARTSVGRLRNWKKESLRVLAKAWACCVTMSSLPARPFALHLTCVARRENVTNPKTQIPKTKSQGNSKRPSSKRSS